jgi:Predicted methyltransferase (contains TPR repeat)
MSFGKAYASVYDEFYRQKDYHREAQFVCEKLQEVWGPKPLRIMDIGCGTGLHDIEIVKAGHSVSGVDLSTEMLGRAELRRSEMAAEQQGRLAFFHGDGRTVRLDGTFDAVISLFHVMSYMAGEGDFDAALATVRSHLGVGGIFLFDFWCGAAVVKDPPEARERTVERDGIRICRRTTPFWDKARNTVKVRFDVEETDTAGQKLLETSEEHVMRYYFDEDITAALARNGFELVRQREWLTDLAPHEKAFGVYALAKAI